MAESKTSKSCKVENVTLYLCRCSLYSPMMFCSYFVVFFVCLHHFIFINIYVISKHKPYFKVVGFFHSNQLINSLCQYKTTLCTQLPTEYLDHIIIFD